MKQPKSLILWVCGLLLMPSFHCAAQAVNVTVALDTNVLAVGGSTTLRVFAQVVPAQQANADRIFSWYVDVLNTNGVAASANYAAMVKTASDNDPFTSSTGTADGAHRRGIYDTFLNLPGAGVSNAVELMAIPVSAMAAGQARFSVQAGTGVGLSHDFIVAPKGGGAPLTNGNYAAAQAVLTVTGTLPPFALSITATNAGSGNKGVRLTWPVTPGFNFTAQYLDQLASGVGWQPLPGGPHNSGSVYEVTPVAKRFYRVAVSPGP